MRLSDLKNLIQDSVSVYKDDGTCNLELLYSGTLLNAPVRVLGMFVGNISVAHNEMHILVYDVPFN